MGKPWLVAPTDEEWAQIQKFMVNPKLVSRDSVGVLYQLAANNLLTEYDTYLSPELLSLFESRLKEGVAKKAVPLRFNHTSARLSLSLGAAFSAELSTVDGMFNEAGLPLQELRAKFFIVDGVESVNSHSLSTEDLFRKYNAGLLPAGSVGFRVGKNNTCSICGTQSSIEDVWNGKACEKHTLRVTYDGKVCGIVLGEREADLLEYSLVARGAISEAGAVAAFSSGGNVTRYSLSDQGTMKLSKTGMKGVAVDEQELMKLMREAAEVSVLKTQLASSQTESKQFESQLKEIQTQLTALQSSSADVAKKLADIEGFRQNFVSAVAVSGVQAYGQDKDPNAGKYAAMTDAELLAAYQNNVKTFFAAIPAAQSGVSSNLSSALMEASLVSFGKGRSK